MHGLNCFAPLTSIIAASTVAVSICTGLLPLGSLSAVSVAQTAPLTKQLSDPDQLLAQAIIAMQESQYADALHLGQQALVRYRSQGNRSGEAQTLTVVGNCYYGLLQYADAIASFRQSLLILVETEDFHLAVITLVGLGNAYLDSGELELAIESLQRGLEMAQILNSEVENFAENSLHRATAEQLYQQGEQQANSNQIDDALHSWQQALDHFQEAEDRTGEGKTLFQIGIAHNALNQYPQAIAALHQSLTLVQEMGDRQMEGMSRVALGFAYAGHGNPAQATESFQQAMAIAQELQHSQMELLAQFGLQMMESQNSRFPQ